MPGYTLVYKIIEAFGKFLNVRFSFVISFITFNERKTISRILYADDDDNNNYFVTSKFSAAAYCTADGPSDLSLFDRLFALVWLAELVRFLVTNKACNAQCSNEQTESKQQQRKKIIITRQLHRCRRHQHPYFIDYDVMFISLRCLFLFHSTLFFEFLKSVRFIVASFWFCARIPITS